eukprot:6150172-Pyramimonas_sp.AAC.3
MGELTPKIVMQRVRGRCWEADASPKQAFFTPCRPTSCQPGEEHIGVIAARLKPQVLRRGETTARQSTYFSDVQSPPPHFTTGSAPHEDDD